MVTRKKQFAVRVRIAVDDSEISGFRTMIEWFRYAGLVRIVESELDGLRFDIFPPKDVSAQMWAERNSERIQSFGYTATVVVV